MRLLHTIFLLLLLATPGCNKKKKPSAEDPAPAQVPVAPADSSTFKCGDLPPEPEQFGWSDSTLDVNNNIKAFFTNPSNADEVIVVVQGDAFGFNKMLNYNLRTKTRKHLANLGQYLPSINMAGWIVFSTAE